MTQVQGVFCALCLCLVTSSAILRAWDDIGTLLVIKGKGSKGKGNSKMQGDETVVATSDLRTACLAFGLFANTILQSENDNGTTTANLLARHLVNELYFSMDDLAEAAKTGDQATATAAWQRGKDYMNAYLRIVNFSISAKVGETFSLIDVSV